MSLKYKIMLSCMVVSSLVMLESASSAASLRPGSLSPSEIQGLRSPRLKELGRKGATLLGEAARGQVITLLIQPQLDHSADLPALIAAQRNPRSSEFKHYLTPKTFRAYFGPSDATMSQLASNLRADGIAIQSVTPNRDQLTATTTVANAESLFGIRLFSINVPGYGIRIINLDDYQIPANLARFAFTINGLDTATMAHTSSSLESGRPSRRKDTVEYGTAVTPATLEFANDMPVLHGFSGTYNQTLAFLIDGQVSQSDIQTTLSWYGITDSYPIHILNTGKTAGSADNLESMLDASVIATTAPGAYLAEYTMPDLSNGSVQTGISYFFNANAKGNSATLSMSFAECDNSSTSFDAAIDRTMSTGVSYGQTYVAGSGDGGYNECTNHYAEVPASDIYVLAVGGTSSVSSDYWSGGPTGQTGWTGSGGGISSYFKKPPFQSQLSGTYRMTPDISLPADAAGGLAFYCTICNKPGTPVGNGLSTGNGTSQASPLAAASFAEISQMTGTANGLVTNALYANFYQGYARGLVDIQTGNNGTAAGPGYDLVSGIGTADWYTFGSQATGI